MEEGEWINTSVLGDIGAKRQKLSRVDKMAGKNTLHTEVVKVKGSFHAHCLSIKRVYMVYIYFFSAFRRAVSLVSFRVRWVDEVEKGGLLLCVCCGYCVTV